MERLERKRGYFLWKLVTDSRQFKENEYTNNLFLKSFFDCIRQLEQFKPIIVIISKTNYGRKKITFFKN